MRLPVNGDELQVPFHSLNSAKHLDPLEFKSKVNFYLPDFHPFIFSPTTPITPSHQSSNQAHLVAAPQLLVRPTHHALTNFPNMVINYHHHFLKGRPPDWLTLMGVFPIFQSSPPFEFCFTSQKSSFSELHSPLPNRGSMNPPIHFCCISFLLFTLEITFKHVTFMWHKIMVKK